MKVKMPRQEGDRQTLCQIVIAYFRDRLSAKQAQENGSLRRERQFDDVLIREA